MAAPSVVAAGLATSGTSTTSVVINKPTGTASGHLLLAVISHGGATSAPTTPPSGWTLHDSSAGSTVGWGGVYYLVAGGSEPSTYTWSGATDSVTGCMIAISGQAASPIDVSTHSVNANANAIVSSITTTGADRLIVALTAINDNNSISTWACATDPTTLTEQAEQLSSGGNDTGSGIATAAKATAGATGTMTGTLSGTRANVTFLYGISPASSSLAADVAGASTAGKSVVAVRKDSGAVAGATTGGKSVVANTRSPAAVAGTATAGKSVVAARKDSGAVAGASTAGKSITAALKTRLASDTFTGTNGDGWSSTWTTGSDTTGSTSTIQSNAGRLTCGSAGAYVGRIGRLVNITAPVDAVTMFKFRWPTGDECYPRFYIRSTNTALDAQGGYYIELNRAGSQYAIGRNAAYVTDTNLGTVTGYTFTSNTWYWVRFGVVGSAVKARVWADGASEPVTWDLTATDTGYTTAGSGCGLSLGPGATASAKWELDDFVLDSVFPPITGVVDGTSTAGKSIAASRKDSAAVSKTVTGAATVTGARKDAGAVSKTVTASGNVTGVRKQAAALSGGSTAGKAIQAARTDHAALSRAVTAAASVSATNSAIAALAAVATGHASIAAHLRLPGAVAGATSGAGVISAQTGVPVPAALDGRTLAGATVAAVIGYYFRTPSIEEHPFLFPRHPLISRLHIAVGVTILRFGASFQQFRDVDPVLVEAADAAYLGGHIYFISPAEAQRLRDAGYGAWVASGLDDPAPDIDYSLYGVGVYGTGPYGD